MKAKDQSVAIERVVENPDNPREDLSEERITSLADSIRKFGVLQPIIVMPHEDEFLILAGHRRLAASRLAGLKKVPVRVITDGDLIAGEIAIQENLQREDLSVTEEFKAFGDLIESGHSPEEVAELAGRSVIYVRQRMAIVSLDPKVLEALEKGTIWFGHAVVLSRLNDQKEQRSWLKKIKEWGLSIERLRKYLAGWRHDGFAFAAGEVKPCKHCRQPEPTLFEDETDPTSSICTNNEHLQREDDRYRDRVGKWAREQGLEVTEGGYHYGGKKLRQGEPPYKIPKGTKAIIRHMEWHSGEYITIGWELSAETSRKEGTSTSGSASRSRSIEAGRERAARETAQRHLTYQITNSVALDESDIEVARSQPQLLAYAFFQLLEYRQRDSLIEHIGLDPAEYDYYHTEDFYRYTMGLNDQIAWQVVIRELELILLDESIPVMADALSRYLDVDPVHTFTAEPEDLGRMKKDEIRTVIPEDRLEEIPKSWSKARHVEVLAGALASDLTWPELNELLTAQIDSEASE